MIPYIKNNSIVYTDSVSDSDENNFNDLPLNFTISQFSSFYNNNQNDNNKTQDPSLNINSSPSPSLIIKKNNDLKSSGNIEKTSKISTKDWKNIQKRLVPSKDTKIKFKVENSTSTQIKTIEKKIGRKKKNDNSKRSHNKYADDNLRRKCKHLVLNSVKEFINEKIRFLYNDDIGNSIYKKEILSFNKEQKFNATVEFNKCFLYKKLKDIFSEKISTKFTNYDSKHNKILIDNLENDKDEYKSQYFKNLFSITFIDCVKHFMGTEYFKELDGMKCFDEVKEQFNNENEYVNTLSYYLMNYEEIINRKKARKSNKTIIEDKSKEQENKDN